MRLALAHLLVSVPGRTSEGTGPGNGRQRAHQQFELGLSVAPHEPAVLEGARVMRPRASSRQVLDTMESLVRAARGVTVRRWPSSRLAPAGPGWARHWAVLS